MQAITYLQFGGNANQALHFYETALQATSVRKVTFGDLGENPGQPMTSEEKEMIMESCLEFLGNKIMMSDVPPFMQAVTGELSTGNTLLISLIDGDPKEYQYYFDALSQEGIVIMPLSKVPWSECFGLVIDKFGVTWKFNSDASKFLSRSIAE